MNDLCSQMRILRTKSAELTDAIAYIGGNEVSAWTAELAAVNQQIVEVTAKMVEAGLDVKDC